MKKKIIIAVAVIVILAAGGTFYLNHKINSAVKDGKIIKGVSCEGISIGGMTRSEAKDAIESHMKEIHQEKITLYVDDERSSGQDRRSLEHSLRQTRQWKKLMHLGEAEVFLQSIPM